MRLSNNLKGPQDGRGQVHLRPPQDRWIHGLPRQPRRKAGILHRQGGACGRRLRAGRDQEPAGTRHQLVRDQGNQDRRLQELLAAGHHPGHAAQHQVDPTAHPRGNVRSNDDDRTETVHIRSRPTNWNQVADYRSSPRPCLKQRSRNKLLLSPARLLPTRENRVAIRNSSGLPLVCSRWYDDWDGRKPLGESGC